MLMRIDWCINSDHVQASLFLAVKNYFWVNNESILKIKKKFLTCLRMQTSHSKGKQTGHMTRHQRRNTFKKRHRKCIFLIHHAQNCPRIFRRKRRRELIDKNRTLMSSSTMYPVCTIHHGSTTTESTGRDGSSSFTGRRRKNFCTTHRSTLYFKSHVTSLE